MQKSTLREYTESVLIAAILALFIRTFVFQAFKIPTGSMEEHLLVGDHILVNKFIYGPTATRIEDWLLPVRAADRQDVMVFRAPQEPDKDFIKRVMGLPGENVVVEGGVVVIDGQPIDDPYANHKSVFGNNFHDTREPFDVPEGEYFAMGDNRENSRDSRYWGAVPASHIKGKAMLVYWSYESDEQEYVGGVRQRLMQFGNVMLHFFTRTRWSRTFKVIQ